jgi:hypothetical protein
MEDVYNFNWADLGDLAEGRPNLGKETSVAVYRLMQYTFKDVFSKSIGKQRTVELFVALRRIMWISANSVSGPQADR